MPRVLLLLLTCLTFGACAGPRPITLHVSTDGGAPIHGATISAVLVQTSLVPLPLNSDTLAEVLTADDQRLFVITDAQGNATLNILERPHALSVSLPALHDLSDNTPWLFTLDPQTRSIVPPTDHPNPGGLAITAVP